MVDVFEYVVNYMLTVSLAESVNRTLSWWRCTKRHIVKFISYPSYVGNTPPMLTFISKCDVNHFNGYVAWLIVELMWIGLSRTIHTNTCMHIVWEHGATHKQWRMLKNSREHKNKNALERYILRRVFDKWQCNDNTKLCTLKFSNTQNIESTTRSLWQQVNLCQCPSGCCDYMPS